MTYYGEYRYNLAQYLKEKPSELIKRDNRLNKQITTYETYVSLINQQRFKNPDYPFYHEGIRLQESSTLPIPIVSSIIKQERFIFSGTKEVRDIIYKDVGYFNKESLLDSINIITNNFLFGDSSSNSEYKAELHEDIPNTDPRLVWEFHIEGSSISNNRYLYLPIRENYLEDIKHLLPSLPMWDVDSYSAWYQYPTDKYLLDTTSQEWPTHYNVLSNDLKHPFIPDFLFTGRVILQGYEGNLLYEYTDIKGVYGLKDEIYLSNLKPLHLDFPIGIPRRDELLLDECLEHSIGYYPSKGNLITDIGRFTGYRTNNKYHPHRTFYLYERSNGTVFLTIARPHSYSSDFIHIANRILELYKEDLVLIGKETEPDYIGINDDKSCGLLFTIEDSLCIPNGYPHINLEDLYSDCIYIGDDYNLPAELIIFNDDLMIDDFLIIGECTGEDPITNCLFNNFNYINNRFEVIDCNPNR